MELLEVVLGGSVSLSLIPVSQVYPADSPALH